MGVVSGYPGDVRVDIMRGGTTVGTKVFPGGAGEVAHDAGNCWDGVPAGTSPDIKGGDKIVATILTGAQTGQQDFFFVRRIQFDETTPGVISGTAFGVPNGDAFSMSQAMTGERIDAQRRNDVGRFDGGGPVDADGNFSFALGGDGGAIGSDFVEGGGNTVTEAGGEGASACGPRQTTALSSVSHGVINAGNVGTDLVLGGPRNDPGQATNVRIGGKDYAPVNGADTWSATVPAADLAALTDNVNHVVAVSYNAAGGPTERRTILKDVTAPVLGATVAPGAYTTGQSIGLTSDGGEEVRYTLDGSPPSSSSRLYDGVPVGFGAGVHTIRTMAIDRAGNRSDASFVYDIASGAVAPTPRPTPPSVVGINTVLQPSRSLTVSALKAASKRIKARNARRNGVRIAMDLKSGTRVVQVSLYRRSGGKRKLVGQVVRFPNRGGAYAVRLRTKSIRKALGKAALYEVVATPGTSQSALVAADAATLRFRVIR
jgi:hypothetical protein